MDRMFKAIVVSSAMLSLSACVTQNFEENNKPVVLNESTDNEIALTRISLGLGYLKMGNTSQAKFNLEKAKKYAPNNVQVYTAFAHYYESVGEDNLTIESYEKALSIKPDDADTLNNYGVFLCRKERLDEAEVQFLKAIEVPTYLRVSKSYENLALCQLTALNFEKTELYLGKAIAHSPSDGSVLYQMMRFQYAIGEYKKAQSYGKRFEKSSRRFSAEYLALAYKVFLKQGNMRTATNYGTMLVKMHPNSWHAKQYLLNGLDSIDADDLAEQYQILVASKHEPIVPKKVVVLSPVRKSPLRLNKNKRSTFANPSNRDIEQVSSVTQTMPLPKNSVSFEPPSAKLNSPSAKLSSPSNNEVRVNGQASKKTKRRVVLKAPRSQIKQNTHVAANDGRQAIQATDALMAQITSVDNQSPSSNELQSNDSQLNDAQLNDAQINDAQISDSQASEDLLSDSELDAIIAEAEALLTPEETALLDGQSEVKVNEAPSSLLQRHQALMAQQNATAQAAMDNKQSKPDVLAAAKVEPPLENEFVTKPALANDGNLLVSAESEQQLPNTMALEQSERSAVIEGQVVYTSFEQLPQHKLVYGENLFTLSKRYNIHLHALKEWNNLSESPVLQVGDIIYLADPRLIETETE